MAKKKTTTRRRRSTKADREFISEAEEIVERMRNDLADLTDQCSGSGDVDPELLNGIFRSAHSLKALAGLFGFEPIQELAHRLEDILDGLRLGRVVLGMPALTLIEEAVNVFGSLLQRIGDSEALAEAGDQITDLSNRIETATQQASPEAGEFDSLDLDASLLRALTEYEEHRLRESLERGRHIVIVESTFEIISFEEGLSELSTAIREIGEVLSTLPAPGETPESQIRFSLLAATDLSLNELSSRLSFPSATVRSVCRARSSAEGTSDAAPPVQPVCEVAPEVPLQPVAHETVRDSENL
ncbi:MAG: Hpt domain-containing protein, partial [Deltaproteobacteria bacterium]|nr:Hpt domain-containing protein [Deltaproteobacteria bacterium]